MRAREIAQALIADKAVPASSFWTCRPQFMSQCGSAMVRGVTGEGASARWKRIDE
jgi:hypothetical protein